MSGMFVRYLFNVHPLAGYTQCIRSSIVSDHSAIHYIASYIRRYSTHAFVGTFFTGNILIGNSDYVIINAITIVFVIFVFVWRGCVDGDGDRLGFSARACAT